MKDFSVDNMKKTGLNGKVCDFSVSYDAIAVDDILGIHRYLMEKKQYNIKCLNLLKNDFFKGNDIFSYNVLNAFQ